MMRARIGKKLHPVLARERAYVTDGRFWKVQLLVLLLVATHALVEALDLLPARATLYFLPESLLLIPVGYAALNFGFEGSLATSLWSSFLALPNVLIWHHGPERDGVLFQLLIVNAVAIFVGSRVDREVLARGQAEAVRQALNASEGRYRALFETSGDAVLVLTRSGTVQQANRSAGELFGRPVSTLAGTPLAELIGNDHAQRLIGSGVTRIGEFGLVQPGGGVVRLDPMCTIVPSDGGEPLIQALLRDVSDQHRRQRELQAHANHVLQAQEDERRRIAQELHDDILQRLIVLLRRLNSLEDGIAPAAPSPRADLAATGKIVEELIVATRGFARQLRPPALEALGLVPGLRRLLQELKDRAAVHAEMTVSGAERRLGEDVELGLFRIAQEALRNVERHARATRVEVGVTFGPSTVELRVSDDGRGFAVDTMPRVGLGLLGMEERTSFLGGQFRIISAPGQGTTILAVVRD